MGPPRDRSPAPLDLRRQHLLSAAHTLAYSENAIGSALLAAPVLFVSGNPVLALNAVLLLACVLCGVGTFVLARRLGMSRGGS